LDAGLNAANDALQKDPSNVAGYVTRGNIYGQEKKWDLAKQDYQHALGLKSNFAPALLSLAEIDLMQAKYDTARAEFADLVQDPDCGDLAKYSVFLCDLAGGHEDLAGNELDAFNRVGSDASYYFANAAWLLHHQRSDDAHTWMDSADRIYSPAKVGRYVTPLVHLGYLSTAGAGSPSN
jgi:Tfp pilus assembly protein PilF